MMLENIQEALQKNTVRRDLLLEQKEDFAIRLIEAQLGLSDAIEARLIIQEVAKNTLTYISMSVGDLVTQAMAAVFTDPYKFIIEFVNRRNSTECDLLFEKRGNRIEPMEASGGGAVDIASFALRGTFFMLEGGLRPLLILDEPFKFVSSDLHDACSLMLKTISEQLGFQIIMVTHLDKIIDAVDHNIEL